MSSRIAFTNIFAFDVVCRLHYINTLKQQFDGTRAYQETDSDEMSVVSAHELPVKFSVCVIEGQDELSTMYWLPKLHKRPYKARFKANSSSCTTTELSKLLTSHDTLRRCMKLQIKIGFR